MIFKLSDLRKTFLYFVQGPKFYGGGGAPTQSSTVTNQATIPDELKPYISTYMGAAENNCIKKMLTVKLQGFNRIKLMVQPLMHKATKLHMILLKVSLGLILCKDKHTTPQKGYRQVIHLERLQEWLQGLVKA